MGKVRVWEVSRTEYSQNNNRALYKGADTMMFQLIITESDLKHNKTYFQAFMQFQFYLQCGSKYS